MLSFPLYFSDTFFAVQQDKEDCRGNYPWKITMIFLCSYNHRARGKEVRPAYSFSCCNFQFNKKYRELSIKNKVRCSWSLLLHEGRQKSVSWRDTGEKSTSSVQKRGGHIRRQMTISLMRTGFPHEVTPKTFSKFNILIATFLWKVFCILNYSVAVSCICLRFAFLQSNFRGRKYS